jgi:hypothetical protein
MVRETVRRVLSERKERPVEEALAVGEGEEESTEGEDDDEEEESGATSDSVAVIESVISR